MIQVRPWTPGPDGRPRWRVDISKQVEGRLVRRRLISPAATKDGSRRWAEKMLAAMDLDEPRKPKASPATSIAVLVDAYLADCRVQGNTPQTLVAKEGVLRRHIVPALGQVELASVGPPHALELQRQLVAKGLGAKTIANVLVVLSSMLRWGVDTGLLQTRPRIRLPKVPRREMDFYDEAQLDELVAAASRVGRHELVLVLLACDAGLRESEIAGLRWRDLKLTAERPHVVVQRTIFKGLEGTTKGKKPRSVPLTPRLEEAVRALPRALRPEQHVIRQQDGKASTQSSLRRGMMRVEREAGWQARGRIHVLRHTFASRLAMAGVPLTTIQALCGHQHVSTTQRYAHLMPGALDAGIAALSGTGSGLARDRAHK